MDLLRTITAERDDLAVQVADLIRERDEMTDLLADTRGNSTVPNAAPMHLGVLLSQVAALKEEVATRDKLLADRDWQALIAQVNDVTRQRDELQEEVAAVRKAGRSAMDERDQARESYRVTLDKLAAERNAWAATEPITNEPYLGLATTEQMFRELLSRFTVGAESLFQIKVAVQLAEILGSLSAREKEYRTVDHG